ncbi:MAG: holo-ACP synthase [Magnetococcus sp. YQC-9]
MGTDLVVIERIGQVMERFPERFPARVFTEAELNQCAGRQAGRIACLAKRFAAKEAFAKALGSGMRDGLWFNQMEVGNDALGRPVMRVSGESARALERLRLIHQAREVAIHLSLADDGGFALAYVVLESVGVVDMPG